MNNNISIAVVGLGYVGLPLAIEFSKKFQTVGFDIDDNRISELCNGLDSSNQITNLDQTAGINKNLEIRSASTRVNSELKSANFF